MRLSVIRELTKAFTAEICGEKITGTFYPANMSGERLDQLREMETNRSNAELLSEVIADWDITGDDDKPLAIDADVIMSTIPYRVVSAIIGGIHEAQSPPASKSETSKGSFRAN